MTTNFDDLFNKITTEENLDEGVLSNLFYSAVLGLSLLSGSPTMAGQKHFSGPPKSQKAETPSKPKMDATTAVETLKLKNLENLSDEERVIFYKTYAKEVDNLINALIQVESSGNDKAVGDPKRDKKTKEILKDKDGNVIYDAYGPLQIHQEVIDDYNKWTGSKLDHKAAFDRATSIKICREYFAHYGKLYMDKTGELPTAGVLARIWNGGPNGWNKAKTIPYADKVKAILKQMPISQPAR